MRSFAIKFFGEDWKKYTSLKHLKKIEATQELMEDRKENQVLILEENAVISSEQADKMLRERGYITN